MDDGQDESGCGRRGEEAARRPLDVRERERERGRHQELPRRGRREPERGVGAAVRGCERRHGHLSANDRERRPDAAEERVARLVGNEQRQRREHRGLVQDDLGRVEEATRATSARKPCQSGKA
jgi:hypothetical protein